MSAPSIPEASDAAEGCAEALAQGEEALEDLDYESAIEPLAVAEAACLGPTRAESRLRARLLLARSFIALDRVAGAVGVFARLLEEDRDFALDSARESPKLMDALAEARARLPPPEPDAPPTPVTVFRLWPSLETFGAARWSHGVEANRFDPGVVAGLRLGFRPRRHRHLPASMGREQDAPWGRRDLADSDQSPTDAPRADRNEGGDLAVRSSVGDEALLLANDPWAMNGGGPGAVPLLMEVGFTALRGRRTDGTAYVVGVEASLWTGYEWNITLGHGAWRIRPNLLAGLGGAAVGRTRPGREGAVLYGAGPGLAVLHASGFQVGIEARAMAWTLNGGDTSLLWSFGGGLAWMWPGEWGE